MLAVVVFVAAVLVLGLDGLIPFGLLLAFTTGSDDDEASRSVLRTPRNLGLAAAMAAALAVLWLWRLDLPESVVVAAAGALVALPIALQESAVDAARDRTVWVTRRSLILGLWGFVVMVHVWAAGLSV